MSKRKAKALAVALTLSDADLEEPGRELEARLMAWLSRRKPEPPPPPDRTLADKLDYWFPREEP